MGDYSSRRVSRIDAETSIITTVAGTGEPGNAGDGGPAAAAQLQSPDGLAFDVAGNLLIVQSERDRVRRVDAKTGIIALVAGGGPISNRRRDNIAASSANIFIPVSVAVDSLGNIYIAERGSSLVRRVDPAGGLISTAVGTNDVGDGGSALAAPLSQPKHIAFDSAGNLYIADDRQHRVRRVDAATGRISTVAGTGIPGFSGDGGPASDALLNRPRGVFVSAANEVFIADKDNGRIRKVDLD